MNKVYGFDKSERLCSGKLTDRLFNEGNRSVGSFPVRLVWLELPSGETGKVQVLLSVPKRRFRHAVDRNRVKRQLREFYRLECGELKQFVKNRGKCLLIGILFTDNTLWETEKLVPRLRSAFDRLLSVLSSENSSVQKDEV
ncbi:MAG: ribonuclease P protein component [Bacteroidaceae bacterium]|nr:ribonuclease P protein component [Bacteroidaceae bacterium]